MKKNTTIRNFIENMNFPAFMHKFHNGDTYNCAFSVQCTVQCAVFTVHCDSCTAQCDLCTAVLTVYTVCGAHIHPPWWEWGNVTSAAANWNETSALEAELGWIGLEAELGRSEVAEIRGTRQGEGIIRHFTGTSYILSFGIKTVWFGHQIWAAFV